MFSCSPLPPSPLLAICSATPFVHKPYYYFWLFLAWGSLTFLTSDGTVKPERLGRVSCQNPFQKMSLSGTVWQETKWYTRNQSHQGTRNWHLKLFNSWNDYNILIQRPVLVNKHNDCLSILIILFLFLSIHGLCSYNHRYGADFYQVLQNVLFIIV